MDLRKSYTLTLTGDEVAKLRQILERIPMSVSSELPVELRSFLRALYEQLKDG